MEFPKLSLFNNDGQMIPIIPDLSIFVLSWTIVENNDNQLKCLLEEKMNYSNQNCLFNILKDLSKFAKRVRKHVTLEEFMDEDISQLRGNPIHLCSFIERMIKTLDRNKILFCDWRIDVIPLQSKFVDFVEDKFHLFRSDILVKDFTFEKESMGPIRLLKYIDTRYNSSSKEIVSMIKDHLNIHPFTYELVPFYEFEEISRLRDVIEFCNLYRKHCCNQLEFKSANVIKISS
jgi:hypothetical protein